MTDRSSTKGWPLPARLLAAMSRDPKAPDYPGGTEVHVGDRALDFVLHTVPDFIERIRGKRVLDYGCGFGDQSIAMMRVGAASVVGYDMYSKMRDVDIPGLEFTSAPPAGKFDVVLSCSAFEHFANPEQELVNMRSLTAPGGQLVITWAEPWYSHNGTHVGFFTKLPWVNLLFSESSVMLVRTLYRDDGATKYDSDGTMGGAVNRMTVGRFEKIVRESGMKVVTLKHFATRKLPLVTQIPVVRELLTSASMVILIDPSV